jgi:aldose sugar dehydrogenase
VEPGIAKISVLAGIFLILSFPAFSSAQSLNDPSLEVSEVASGLSQPTAMAFIGPGDILILQKGDGRVRRVVNGVLQPGEVLDVAVDNASERGLLGVAIHPNFPSTPFIYLYFTQSSTANDTSGSPLANRIFRYTWNGSALVNPILILDLPVTPGPNHDGGAMTFGPDGKLYAVIGDLNRDGQLQNFSAGPAPDNTGVIFRVNDDGSAPNDNPFFVLGGNLAKYYAYGVRNSFGLAFDPITGELWNTENGPNSYDEINLVLPGFNSGWEQIMGPGSRDPQGLGNLVFFPGSHYADPKFSWLNPVGPTALVFLNSARLGVGYQNHLFVGDINNGNLYSFRVNVTRNGFDFANPGLSDLVADNSAEFQEVLLGTGFGGITDLKVGPDGLLYVLSFGLGKIFAISGRSRHTSIGIFREGGWALDLNGNSWWDGCGVDSCIGFGGTFGDIPVAGDWTGTGVTSIGIFRGGGWALDLNGNDQWDGCGIDGCFAFGGFPGDMPVVGDWTGTGQTKIGVYRGGGWALDLNGNGQWDGCGVDGCIGFGGFVDDIPVVGDWTGTGVTKIGLYRNGGWVLDLNGNGQWDGCGVDGCFAFGGFVGDVPVVGDWTGTGVTKIGLYRNGGWVLDLNGNGQWDGCGIDGCFAFGGTPGDIPITGNW